MDAKASAECNLMDRLDVTTLFSGDVQAGPASAAGVPVALL